MYKVEVHRISGEPTVVVSRTEAIDTDVAWGQDLALDALTEEVLQIGETDGFLSFKPSEKFTASHRNVRVREIGEILDAQGGMGRMLVVHERVMQALGYIKACELEMAWDEVGEWLG